MGAENIILISGAFSASLSLYLTKFFTGDTAIHGGNAKQKISIFILIFFGLILITSLTYINVIIDLLPITLFSFISLIALPSCIYNVIAMFFPKSLIMPAGSFRYPSLFGLAIIYLYTLFLFLSL